MIHFPETPEGTIRIHWRQKMEKQGQTIGKNPNPLNNTFGNGNSAMKKGSLDDLRDMFDKHRERVEAKKLRDITGKSKNSVTKG